MILEKSLPGVFVPFVAHSTLWTSGLTAPEPSTILRPRSIFRPDQTLLP